MTKIHFNIILQSMPNSNKRSLPSDFSLRYAVFFLPRTCYMPHLSLRDTSIHIRKSLHLQCFPASVPNIFLSLSSPTPLPLPLRKRQSKFHPHTNNIQNCSSVFFSLHFNVAVQLATSAEQIKCNTKILLQCQQPHS